MNNSHEYFKRVLVILLLMLAFASYGHAAETLVYTFSGPALCFKSHEDVDWWVGYTEMPDRKAQQHFEDRMIEAGRAYIGKVGDHVEVVNLIDPSIISGGAIWVWIKGQPGYWITLMGKLKGGEVLK